MTGHLGLILHPLMFRHWFVHPGWFIGFGVLVWLAMIALLVGLVVVLVRRDRRQPPGFLRPRPPSLDILEERYARGEISRDEFIERRQVLTGSGPDDSTTPIPPPASGSP